MAESPRRVRVFFYGTFMDPAVLSEHGVAASDVMAASVSGFDLVVGPRVNLVRSDWACSYGALIAVTHDDLSALYAGLEERFGVQYLPEAVLARTRDGVHTPALCYIAHEMAAGKPDPAYVAHLAACIRALGLPDWYASRVESLGSGSGDAT
jgi:hypothetical protein